MSYFERAIIPVLQHEGGYCNDANDPGGETNFGVCKRNYPDLDIKNLTVEDACEIYQRDYWRPYMDLLDYCVASKLFDASVNMGHSQANKLIQRAVGAVDDGVVGKNTINAINSLPAEEVLHKFVEQLNIFYNGLVERKPVMAKFLKGWLKRANWIPTV